MISQQMGCGSSGLSRVDSTTPQTKAAKGKRRSSANPGPMKTGSGKSRSQELFTGQTMVQTTSTEVEVERSEKTELRADAFPQEEPHLLVVQNEAASAGPLGDRRHQGMVAIHRSESDDAAHLEHRASIVASDDDGVSSGRFQQNGILGADSDYSGVGADAEGSNSTDRLSVDSESFNDLSDSPRSKGVGRGETGGLAFFSTSVFAPHTPQDAMELQRRLKGGYTDTETRQAFLTMKQRWDAIHQETMLNEELQKRRVFPPPYLAGEGVLWVDLNDVKHFPGPLPRPFSKRKDTNEEPSLTKQQRTQQKMYQQLLTSLLGALPDFEEALKGPDVSTFALQKCALRVKEYFSWCSDTSVADHHNLRLRTILSQLQVSLRDMAILLQDPKRCIEAFARMDPQGLMFQSEVLSLQGDADAPLPSARALVPINQTDENLQCPDSEGHTTVRLLAKKAREVSRLTNLCSAGPGSVNPASTQWQAALRLFRYRELKRLRYIVLILRNAVEIEMWLFRQRTEGKVSS